MHWLAALFWKLVHLLLYCDLFKIIRECAWNVCPNLNLVRRFFSRLLIGGENFFLQIFNFGEFTLTGDSGPLVDPRHPILVFLEQLEHQDLDLIGFIVIRSFIPL